MMIKKNHKASILIEIIVIKNTHKHWQPFLHLRTSANTGNALIQWSYPKRQSITAKLTCLRIKMSCPNTNVLKYYNQTKGVQKQYI